MSKRSLSPSHTIFITLYLSLSFSLSLSLSQTISQEDPADTFNELLSELSSQLERNMMSLTMIDRLPEVEKRCKEQIERMADEEDWKSIIALKTANIITQAYLYQGREEEVVSVGKKAYEGEKLSKSFTL